LNGRVDCAGAERLAGTIAVNEATDAQRDAYRAHLAGCGHCLRDLGGEREIERVMGTIAQARDAERWQPNLRSLSRRRAPGRAGAWAAALAAAIVIAAGIGLAEHQVRPASTTASISPPEARALAALGTQTMPRLQGRAESLSVGAATVTTLNLRIDARGIPLQCTVATSSGDRAKDGAICRAAMHRRYSAP